MKTKFCNKCNKETDRYACGSCKPCKKAYMTEWNKAHPLKSKEYSATYLAANKEKESARKAAWRIENPEKAKAAIAAWNAAHPERIKATKAAWRLANPDKGRVACAIYYASHREKRKSDSIAYRAANPEKVRAWNADWHKTNPEIRRVLNHDYRARKCNAGGKLSKNLLEKLYKLQCGKCACCTIPFKKAKVHMDHIIALVNGGLNTDDNIQLLCASCNCSKQSKHPIDFMQSRGFLL